MKFLYFSVYHHHYCVVINVQFHFSWNFKIKLPDIIVITMSISEFNIELELRMLAFSGGWKTAEPGEKPSEQGREPTTNSTLT